VKDRKVPVARGGLELQQLSKGLLWVEDEGVKERRGEGGKR